MAGRLNYAVSPQHYPRVPPSSSPTRYSLPLLVGPSRPPRSCRCSILLAIEMLSRTRRLRRGEVAHKVEDFADCSQSHEMFAIDNEIL